MPNDKQAPRELKVTDKRIFTPEGEIRDEFKQEIRPAEPQAAAAAEANAPQAQTPAAEAPREPQQPPQQNRRTSPGRGPQGEERRRTVAGTAEDPGTPFSDFIRGLIAQAYMFLGMLRDPYSPQAPKIDAVAARQMIDIVSMLQEKTAGNLTPEEDDFLAAHLAELKLAFVQRTKSI